MMKHAVVFLHWPSERLCAERTMVAYMISIHKWGSIGSAIQPCKAADFDFAHTPGLAHSTLWWLAVLKKKRQQQDYLSSASFSVTSGTAGGLARWLCEESDSYSSCHDTDWLDNITLCLATKAAASPDITPARQVMWVTAFLFIGWLHDQNQGVNVTDGEHKR